MLHSVKGGSLHLVQVPGQVDSDRRQSASWRCEPSAAAMDACTAAK